MTKLLAPLSLFLNPLPLAAGFGLLAVGMGAGREVLYIALGFGLIFGWLGTLEVFLIYYAPGAQPARDLKAELRASREADKREYAHFATGLEPALEQGGDPYAETLWLNHGHGKQEHWALPISLELFAQFYWLVVKGGTKPTEPNILPRSDFTQTTLRTWRNELARRGWVVFDRAGDASGWNLTRNSKSLYTMWYRANEKKFTR